MKDPEEDKRLCSEFGMPMQEGLCFEMVMEVLIGRIGMIVEEI